MVQSPAPPILYPIIIHNGEDPARYQWFYGEDAGGHILSFGTFRDRKLYEVSSSYLEFCIREFDPMATRNRQFLDAFQKFVYGLKVYSQTNYGDFVVPFGDTYRGMTIRQCQDRSWLDWVCKQKVLREKHQLFIMAAEAFLANDNPQEVQRRIAGGLTSSAYANDLNLAGYLIGSKESREVPPDVRHAVDVVVSYVYQQPQIPAAVASDPDVEMADP